MSKSAPDVLVLSGGAGGAGSGAGRGASTRLPEMRSSGKLHDLPPWESTVLRGAAVTDARTGRPRVGRSRPNATFSQTFDFVGEKIFARVLKMARAMQNSLALALRSRECQRASWIMQLSDIGGRP